MKPSKGVQLDLNFKGECVFEGVRVGAHTCGQAWLAGIAPGASVHLLKEFVGGVLVAMVLHFVELPLLRGQHGVDLLRKRRELELCRWVPIHKKGSHLSIEVWKTVSLKAGKKGWEQRTEGGESPPNFLLRVSRLMKISQVRDDTGRLSMTDYSRELL